ncbi:MAG: hypothetical protein B6D55_05875, partial [Candidatus Omnitrophica bacterium 4484_70.2]
MSIFIILCLFSFLGIGKITVGENTPGTSYLYPESPFNKAERFINKNFGGTNTYYILVESEDSLLKVSKLKAIEELQDFILKNVSSCGSASSFVDAINFKDHKASTVEEAVRKTEEFLKTHKFGDIKFSYAGGDIGISFAVNEIIKKTILPNILFISFLIFLYVSFVYKSFTSAGILLIPLLISNLIVFSLFGFLKTSLTTETLPLASLSEGLGINYGIYILSRLYEEMKKKKKTYRK